VRLEGVGQLKSPMTSSGVESAAFRLVATISADCFRFVSDLESFKLCFSAITLTAYAEI
jgi:hypothetical protein